MIGQESNRWDLESERRLEGQTSFLESNTVICPCCRGSGVIPHLLCAVPCGRCKGERVVCPYCCWRVSECTCPRSLTAKRPKLGA